MLVLYEVEGFQGYIGGAKGIPSFSYFKFVMLYIAIIWSFSRVEIARHPPMLGDSKFSKMTSLWQCFV